MLEKYKAGTLQLGHTYVYENTNGGVGLLLNTALVPPSVAARIEGWTRQVAAGKIQVPCVAGFCSPATPCTPGNMRMKDGRDGAFPADVPAALGVDKITMVFGDLPAVADVSVDFGGGQGPRRRRRERCR